MGEDERRIRKLTPMSGELRAGSDWAPGDPAAKPRRRKKEKAAPQTRGRVILAGMRRFVVILVLLSGLAALIGALFVWFRDSDPARAFPLSFIIVGALLAGSGFLGATSGPSADWMPEAGFERGEREHAFNMSFVYGAFGVALVCIGLALDALL